LSISAASLFTVGVINQHHQWTTHCSIRFDTIAHDHGLHGFQRRFQPKEGQAALYAILFSLTLTPTKIISAPALHLFASSSSSRSFLGAG